MPRIVIGCDLSRAWLDLHSLPGGRTSRIDNTPAGIAAWAAEIDVTALVLFEATSGCNGPLMAALAGRGIAFARVNPRQAREFARACGVLAKTDRVDARLLAERGRRLALEITSPPDPERTRLADFVRRRRPLVEMRKAEKVRRHSAGQPELLREIEGMIALLDRSIDRPDCKIAELIAKSPTLAAKARLLAAVPGVGPAVLAILLGALAELGALCTRRIASLAGSAPLARESGLWRGARRIWGGRRRVREALSIAALSAIRRIRALVAPRERMRAAGKAPNTILIAAGRHLLVILNTLIRSQQPLRL